MPVSRIIKILRRRKWLFIIPFSVVFALPVVWSIFFMRSYQSTSLVWLDSNLSKSVQVAVQGSQRPIQTLADTFEQMLRSGDFVIAVVNATPLRSQMASSAKRAATIAMIRENLTAEVVGPNALQITYSGRSPDEAVAVVDATTSMFLDSVKGAVGKQDSTSMRDFSEQSDAYLAAIDTARAELQAYVAQHPGVGGLETAEGALSASGVSGEVLSEYSRLKAQSDRAQELYDAYNGSLPDLVKAQALATASERNYVNGLRQEGKPTRPTSFSKRGPLLLFVLASIAAMLIGGMAVAYAEATDPTLHDDQDVEDAVGLPVLAVIPRGAVRARQT